MYIISSDFNVLNICEYKTVDVDGFLTLKLVFLLASYSGGGGEGFLVATSPTKNRFLSEQQNIQIHQPSFINTYNICPYTICL